MRSGSGTPKCAAGGADGARTLAARTDSEAGNGGEGKEAAIADCNGKAAARGAGAAAGTDEGSAGALRVAPVVAPVVADSDVDAALGALAAFWTRG